MQNFIEKQANNFGEAHQEQVLNKLIQVIDEKINLQSFIDKDNEAYVKEHKEFIDKLNKDELETYKDTKPQVVEFKDSIAKFQYAFNKLLETWLTLIHDVDASGQLVIKIFKLQETKSFKFKTSYKVELN